MKGCVGVRAVGAARAVFHAGTSYLGQAWLARQERWGRGRARQSEAERAAGSWMDDKSCICCSLVPLHWWLQWCPLRVDSGDMLSCNCGCVAVTGQPANAADDSSKRPSSPTCHFASLPLVTFLHSAAHTQFSGVRCVTATWLRHSSEMLFAVLTDCGVSSIPDVETWWSISTSAGTDEFCVALSIWQVSLLIHLSHFIEVKIMPQCSMCSDLCDSDLLINRWWRGYYCSSCRPTTCGVAVFSVVCTRNLIQREFAHFVIMSWGPSGHCSHRYLTWHGLYV